MNKKVNINTASFEELQRIIHIGPVRADLIYTNRIWHNIKFKDVHELSVILGLGPIRMADIVAQNLVEV